MAVGGVLVLALGSGFATAQEREAPAPPAKPEPAAPQTVSDLTTGLNPEDLVESLIGEGVTYDNVAFTGDRRGAGMAGGFGATFGVDAGVLLSSGAVAGESSNVDGPNTTLDMTTEFSRPGDTDLDALVAPNVTLDATTLEFDFVADTDHISFQYVFGSEEYNEYVGSKFDDVFAFFVNGQNCATVGTPPQRVSINTINAGLSGTEVGVNAGLYVNNVTNAHDTELDGFTRVLTCDAEVEPGATSHVKLSIADTSDPVLDSTVLIAADTFSINHVPTADDQHASTPAETPVDLTLTGSDTDGDPLTYALQSDPAHGQVTGTAPDVTYTPADGFTGNDQFTFTVSDGVAVSEPATVTIDVTAPPEPTDEPTQPPTDEPTQEPTEDPTGEPTDEPTPEPSESATPEPSPEEHLPNTGVDQSGWLLGLATLLVGASLALRVARWRPEA